MSKIEEMILAEGGARAEEILAAGEAAVREIEEKAERERATFRAAEAEKAEEAYRERIRVKVSNAELEAKKILLAAKAEVLNDVYRAALGEVAQLPKAEYLKLLQTALTAAEAGDTAYLNAADAKKVTAAWWKKTAPAGVTLSNEALPIAGGVVFKGASVDKNCSLEAEMAQFREETEMELSKRLFGAGE